MGDVQGREGTTAGHICILCSSARLSVHAHTYTHTQSDTNAHKLQQTRCASITSSVYLYENILVFAFPALSTQQRYTLTGKYSMDGKRKEESCKKESQKHLF